MARAHLRKGVIRKVSGAPTGGTCEVLDVGTGVATTEPLYTTADGVTTLPNPFTFTDGVVDFYVDGPKRVHLAITPDGGTLQTFLNEDIQAPAGSDLPLGHTFSVPGELLAASGQDNVIPGFFVHVPEGRTATLVAVRHVLLGGTSLTATLHRNGNGITGLTGHTVNATATTSDPVDVELADNDYIQLGVSAVSGSPKNLSYTVFIEYGYGG